MIFSQNWKGFYEYGFGYEPPLFASRINFEANFNGNINDFTGSFIEEDFNSKLTIKSVIKGYFENEMMHFTKKYESIVLVKENDTYSEINPLPEIHYIGEINSDKNILFGKWETLEKITENGEEIELFNEGIWQLKSF